MFEFSQTRQPRGVVKINGTPIWGWVDFSVDTNAFREADTFSVTFAMKGLPPERNASWLSEQTTMQVELWAGFPIDPNNYTSDDLELLLAGNVDSTGLRLVGRKVELSGRDLTSLFIDAKTTESFKNQTAKQIVQTLASRHGLQAVIKVSDSSLQGGFYQIDHAIPTQCQTEWDLLCYLAQSVGAVVYVNGKTLYFVDPPDDSSAPKFPIVWKEPDEDGPAQANLTDISFDRTLTVGKTITVTVRSWNQQQRKGFTVSYPSTHGSTIRPGQATSPAQNYSRTIPNLTKEQATKLAQKIYNDLIQNEMRASIDTPAASPSDFDLTYCIPISGTGTKFDQTYFPTSIQRSMSIDSGYRMKIDARNHSDDVTEV